MRISWSKKARVLSTTIVLGSTLLVLSACATANNIPGTSFVGVGAPTLPPAGFLDFCSRYPSQCPQEPAATTSATPIKPNALAESEPAAIISGGTGRFDWSAVFSAANAQPGSSAGDYQAAYVPMALTAALWSELNSVNQQVNSQIRPASDEESSGTADRWDLPILSGSMRGDCEDYALEKRRKLEELGLPPANLSLAIVATGWGETHAVLLVETSQGDYVMDSLASDVEPWAQTGYHWIKRQTSGNSLAWAQLSNP